MPIWKLEIIGRFNSVALPVWCMDKNPWTDRDRREPVHQSEVGTSFGITLARIRWDYFATLTFKGNIPRSNICYGLAFRWLQDFAKISGVPYKRLLIALRGEIGEQRGRFHFHCLLGGVSTRNYHTAQWQLERLWKSQTGGARVDVRQYDRSQAGAEYVAKRLGANAYELSKYSFADTVTLSRSVYRLIAVMDAFSERRGRPGHMAKRDGAGRLNGQHQVV
ncbi:MAG TPA: hypothetical protein VNV43_13940 [Candidatus Acidoferrales bacterium]|nr:hypothetical protein [Candidatus Acidoferrales bacterium]